MRPIVLSSVNTRCYLRIQSKKTPVNLREVIMMGVEAVKPCSDFKTNKISVNIATELVVAIDKFAISAVVKNILDNAIKFTLFGGWVRICASEDKDEDRIVIVIKDNGVGMKKNSTK